MTSMNPASSSSSSSPPDPYQQYRQRTTGNSRRSSDHQPRAPFVVPTEEQRRKGKERDLAKCSIAELEERLARNTRLLENPYVTHHTPLALPGGDLLSFFMRLR